jgi:F-type H+-transporting ATPase subunit b
LKENIIADAKNRAKQEADKIVANAREEVVNEKNAALAELKSHVALLSLNIAEKVLRSNLSNDEKQTELVGKLLEETDLN